MINKDIQFASDLRTVVTRLTKKLRKLSKTGLQFSFTERSTLSLLLHSENGLLPSELAAAEKITNQSMSQILNRFLKDGLITRTASQTDKRKVIIAITDTGKQVILQVLSERDEWMADAISKLFSEEEYNSVKNAIGPLTKLVDFE